MSYLGCTIWFSTLMTNSYLIFFFYIVFTGSRTWLGYLVKNITSLSVRYLQLAQIWYRPSFSIQSYFVKLPAQRSDDLTWKNTKRKNQTPDEHFIMYLESKNLYWLTFFMSLHRHIMNSTTAPIYKICATFRTRSPQSTW